MSGAGSMLVGVFGRHKVVDKSAPAFIAAFDISGSKPARKGIRLYLHGPDVGPLRAKARDMLLNIGSPLLESFVHSAAVLRHGSDFVELVLAETGDSDDCRLQGHSPFNSQGGAQ